MELASSHIFRPESFIQPLNLDQLFPSKQPVEVELGCGDGSFLAAYAAAHPDRNFVGVERLLGRLRKTDRKLLRAGVTNTKLLRLEASYLAMYLLPANSIDAFHIYFPDPWPKRKHRPRRLINPEFREALYKTLNENGVVFLRTDHADYAEQMKSVFEQGRFRFVETPPELAAIKTDFERGFETRGVPTFNFACKKTG